MILGHLLNYFKKSIISLEVLISKQTIDIYNHLKSLSIWFEKPKKDNAKKLISAIKPVDPTLNEIMNSILRRT